jgi:hypothetical protein
MAAANGLGVVCGDAKRCAESDGRLSTLRSLDVMPGRGESMVFAFVDKVFSS